MTSVWSRNEGIRDWAERAGVLVVGVDAIFNATGEVSYIGGTEYAAGAEAMEPYLRLADSIPRAHPGVRLMLDINSGGGGKCWDVAARYPKKIAGVVIGPTHGAAERPFSRLPHPSVAVCVMKLERGDFDPNPRGWAEGGHARWMRQVAPALRANGNPLREIAVPKNDMNGEPVRDALDWLLETARLLHPSLNEQERAVAGKALAARLAEARQQSFSAARRDRLESLLSVLGSGAVANGAGAKHGAAPRAAGPAPATGPAPAAREVLALWRAAAVEEAAAIKNPLERYDRVSDLRADPRMTKSEQVKELSALPKGLKDDPTLREELAAHDALRKIAAVEEQWHAGTRKGSAQELVAAYAQLFKRYPRTAAATVARQRAASLTRYAEPKP